MGVFDYFSKAAPTPAVTAPLDPRIVENKADFGRVGTEEGARPRYGMPAGDGGLFKAYIPQFMYKPPFGYPRDPNTAIARKLGATAYIQSITGTIAQQVSTCAWDIKVKKGYDMTPALEAKAKEIREFFRNPNRNEESFEHLTYMMTVDMLEVGNGTGVKVYDGFRKLTELYARDSASFLKNPDMYGRMGDRAGYIPWHMYAPSDVVGVYTPKLYNAKNKEDLAAVAEMAAYWQYSWTYGSIPVPFGRDEILWVSGYPRTDGIYDRGPLQILGDVLWVLIYGAAMNVDLYLNNQIPEGVISLIGAEQDHIDAFKSQWYGKFRERDVFNNDRKKWFSFPITNQEVKYTPLMVSAKDLEVLQQQEWFWKLTLACFGMTSEEMGFTDTSGSKNVSQSQTKVFKRKTVSPILRKFEYSFTTQIIETDFESPELEFKYDDYDIDEDLLKHDLYEKKLRMGLATVNEIREKEGEPPLPGGDLTNFEKDQLMNQQLSGAKPGDAPVGDNTDVVQASAKAVPTEGAPLNSDERAFEATMLQGLAQVERDVMKIING